MPTIYWICLIRQIRVRDPNLCNSLYAKSRRSFYNHREIKRFVKLFAIRQSMCFFLKQVSTRSSLLEPFSRLAIKIATCTTNAHKNIDQVFWKILYWVRNDPNSIENLDMSPQFPLMVNGDVDMVGKNSRRRCQVDYDLQLNSVDCSGMIFSAYQVIIFGLD